MIDTLVLRIKGYEKYIHLVNYLKQVNTNDFIKKVVHDTDDHSIKKSLVYGDTGRILTLTHRSSIRVVSSHYDISFLLSKERDFLEFNFSIPKYLFATNVLQFIDPHNTSPEHVYDKLINFIYRFFAEYLPVVPDYQDVEINRIDLCYNQFFLSKEDALKYLDQQRNLNVNYARSEKNRFQSYGSTTVQYVTDTYSFKIYHKGTEFRTNDLNKLLKNNPKGYNLSELQDTADKILRYEITVRKGLMNYLFKQRLKDDENTFFHHNLTQLRKLRNKKIYTMNKHLNKMTIPVGGTNQIDLFIEKTLPGKTFSFHLESLWDYPIDKPIDLLENFNLGFNKDLFREIHAFFWERVNKYQLGVKMSLQDVYKKIKDFQKDKDLKNKLYANKDNISHAGNLLLIATLSQYTDISELKGILPKATYYRYCKKLEELGIPKHSPDIAVAPPALDYTTYLYYFGKYHNIYN